MPKYKCIKPFLYTRKVDGVATTRLYEAGSIVDYDGHPSENLEPTCKEGEARRRAFDEIRAKQRRDAVMRATPQGDVFAEAIQEALEAAFARMAEKRTSKAKAEAA